VIATDVGHEAEAVVVAAFVDVAALVVELPEPGSQSAVSRCPHI